jgi:hypothetical protein
MKDTCSAVYVDGLTQMREEQVGTDGVCFWRNGVLPARNLSAAKSGVGLWQDRDELAAVPTLARVRLGLGGCRANGNVRTISARAHELRS